MVKAPKVGVLLGGGGIKPFAALPLFEFLKKQGIPFPTIVGSSGGSLVAALAACGYTLDEVSALVKEVIGSNIFSINYKTLMALFGVPFCKLETIDTIGNTTRYRKKLLEIFGDRRIEELPTKLIIETTNVMTGEIVVLKEGYLRDAIYASTAIYPFMPPQLIDGNYLVDGCFSNPFGFTDLVNEHVDLIIFVTFNFVPDYNPSHFLDYFNNLFCLSMERKGRQAQTIPIALFTGEIVFVEMRLDRPATIFDTHRIPGIIQAGEKIVDIKSDEILSVYKGIQNQYPDGEEEREAAI